MRASRLVVYLLMCSFGFDVVACSGGDPKELPIDASRDTPSKPQPDAGVKCAQRGTMDFDTLDFSTAGQAQGVVIAGDTQLRVAALVTTDEARTMGFVIVQRNNSGVFANATGRAGRFEKPPATGLYTMDTDSSFGFEIVFVDGITVNRDGTVGFHPTQVALPDPVARGSVRIDTWAPGATPGGTSVIGATFSNARFTGFNLLASGDADPVGNGCDILVPHLQFKNLKVKWQTAPFPENVTAPLTPPRSLAPWTIGDPAVLPADLAFDR